jgi:glucose/arabinose dehydrogenase
MVFPRRRRAFRPAFLPTLLAGGGLVAPGVARADLVAPFDTAITVDPGYVTGANSATDIAWAADGRAVITRKGGEVVIRNTDGTKTELTGLFGTVDTGSEKGLLGVVAHPTTANTFFFYASNGPSAADNHRVYRGMLDASSNALTIDSANPIVAAGRNAGDPGLEGPANHDGGGLFVHGNHLYIGVGDTGANATPPVNRYGSCLNKGNGKILRVNLDGTIPSDNPLVGVTTVTGCASPGGAWEPSTPDQRIFAWGFRNPWRLWVDSHTGLMWIGDVGETTREEISVGPGNQHYGYPFNEGNVRWPDNVETGDGTLDGRSCETNFAPAKACTYPAHDYDRTVGGCVIGGLIPEGCGWQNAFGGKTYYLFGDHGQTWLHALEVKDDRSGVVSSAATELGTLSSGVASFRQGPDGSVYLVNYGVGAVYRLTPTEQSGPDCMSGGGTGGTGAGGNGSNGGRGGMAGEGEGGDDAGAAGEAGASGEGGAMGGAPVTGKAGNGGRGGRGGQGGGSGSANIAGEAGQGGEGGSGARAGGPAPSDDGGCGCRVARGNRDATLEAVVVGLALAGALGRRGRRRNEKGKIDA